MKHSLGSDEATLKTDVQIAVELAYSGTNHVPQIFKEREINKGSQGYFGAAGQVMRVIQITG